MKDYRVLAYSIFGLLILSSCIPPRSIGTSETRLPTTPQPIHTLAPTSTTTLVATSTLLPTVSNIGSNPPIAFIVRPMSTDGCRGSFLGQLWYLPYPYASAQMLLSDSEIDINSPEFSPDNDLISYVASNPAQILGGNPLDEFGFERMEIIKTDGTNRQPLGEDLPAQTIIDTLMGNCMNISNILSSQAWSPDGQRVLFTEKRYKEGKQWKNYDIYLAEIGTSKLYLIQNQSDWAPYSWLNVDEILLAGDNGINWLKFNSLGELEKSNITFPEGLNLEKIVKFFPQSENSVIISTVDDNENRSSSLWKLSLAPEVSWEKVVDLGSGYSGTPFLGTNYSAICDDEREKLIILDNTDWIPVGSFDFPLDQDVHCDSSLQMVHDAGRDIAYFVAYSDNFPMLYSVVLGPGDLDGKLIFNTNKLSLPSSETGYVLNYTVGNTR